MLDVSNRLAARVRADFDADSVDDVLARVASLHLVGLDTDSGRERVQAAVVLLANGDAEALDLHAPRAEIDWRDVLVAAELADDDWRERLDAQLGPPS